MGVPYEEVRIAQSAALACFMPIAVSKYSLSDYLY